MPSFLNRLMGDVSRFVNEIMGVDAPSNHPKVGLHGVNTGIEDKFLRPVHEAGLPIHAKLTNNLAGSVIFAKRYPHPDNVIISRNTNPGGRANDTIPDGAPPEEAEQIAQDLFEDYMADIHRTIELDQNVGWGDLNLVYQEWLNEIGTSVNNELLARVMYHMALLALGEPGLKVFLGGMNAGEPEPEQWAAYRPFLELCIQHPDRLGISLHEAKLKRDDAPWDYTSPIENFYPHLVGRFEWLIDYCMQEFGQAPSIAISEWAWSYDKMPPYDQALADVDWYVHLINQYPTVLGFYLWNLNSGKQWGDLPKQMMGFLEPLGQYVINTELPEPEPEPEPEPPPEPPPGGRGDPREQYARTYILLPPTAGEEWAIAAASGCYGGVSPSRNTIGGSADDGAIGDLDRRKIIAVNPAEWGPGEDGKGLRGFFERYYGLGHYHGLEYEELIAETPEDLRRQLAGEDAEEDPGDPEPEEPPTQVVDGFDAPIGTAEERRAAVLWPGAWVNANWYANKYTNPSTNNTSYHTGADLNLNEPYWDADRGKPVYAVADGKVIEANRYQIWGNIIVIEHLMPDGRFVYSRYVHVGKMLVIPGQRVTRGQQISTIDRDALQGPYHLHFDISQTDALLVNPADWPGLNLDRLLIDYTDPKQFIGEHRPGGESQPRVEPQVGMHNEDGADWMLATGTQGYAIHSVALGPNATRLDFTRFGRAGIKMLVRLNWGYHPNGTIPDIRNSTDVNNFINACVETMRQSVGVHGWVIANEGNNPAEWPNNLEIMPETYASIYNDIWSRKPVGVRMGPLAVDPYYGPNSDSREWWMSMLEYIGGADFLTVHPKTQDSNPDSVDSDAKFANEPLTWQFLHLRAFEPLLAAVPERFRALPVYATEANPQRKLDGHTLGWEAATGAEWVHRAMARFRDWNRQGNQQIHGIIFYRFTGDAWALYDKRQILDAIHGEAI